MNKTYFTLVEDLDKFFDDIDHWDYNDVMGSDKDKRLTELERLLENEPDALINCLSDIIDLDDDEETTAEAKALLARVNGN